MENVLAKELLIGTIPRNGIKAVKQGKTREYRSKGFVITHLSVSPHMYFGFYSENGIQYADREKALLDVLYFYMRGMKFYFDIFSDIDTVKIDRKKFSLYLLRYRNSKFIKFAEGYMSER
jgi:hypothetical protein